MNVKMMFLPITLVALMLIAPGCTKKEETSSSRKRLTVAVVPKGANQVYWKTVHAGSVKAERELGVDVIFKGPIVEDDRESQIKVMEDFISRGVDGIALAPLDNTALRPVVHEAVKNDIPVVIFDSALNSDQYISFVATDNYDGGLKAGRHLAGLLQEKGKVMMVRFLEGSASTTKREQGFLDAIEKFPQIEVVSSDQRVKSTSEEALSVCENILSTLKTPDGGLSIDGIFCPNEFTVFAMLRALQDGGLAGKVKFVGFDSSEMLVKAMTRGEIHGLVLQDPINMGYLGVKTLVSHLKGQTVEKRIDTGSRVATADNMNTPEIKSLLEPDYKKWLGEE